MSGAGGSTGAPGSASTPRPGRSSARRHAAPAPRVDLVGIGVQKSATSWLFSGLSAHPEVRVAQRDGAPLKEVNFFNHMYERGYGWYHEHFAFGPWITAEFSVLYFPDADAARRLHRYNPDAKLVLSLRDPVDRAYSQHRHEYRRGRLAEGPTDFWTGLANNPSYVEQGRYAEHLERWLEVFPREQLHVIDYDDVRWRPEQVLADLFRFVGIDPSFVPPTMDRRINVSTVGRPSRLHRAIGLGSQALRRLASDAAFRTLRSSRMGRTLRGWRNEEVGEAHVPPLSAEDRARVAEYFRDDLARLGVVLGRDFSRWGRSSASGRTPEPVGGGRDD